MILSALAFDNLIHNGALEQLHAAVYRPKEVEMDLWPRSAPIHSAKDGNGPVCTSALVGPLNPEEGRHSLLGQAVRGKRVRVNPTKAVSA